MTTVAILTSSHSTFDSRVFHKQARSLSDAGYDVTLITPHDSDMERDGVKIRAVRQEDVESADFGHAREIYREAKRIQADIYHFHDPGLLPFGLMLSYRTEGKVIYDCHEQYEKAFRNYGFPPDLFNPLVRLYPMIQSMICNRLDAVVTTTEETAEDFRRRGHSTVTTVRNFPITTDINIGEPPIEASTDYLLVYVGGLSETRGLTQMIRLVSALRERSLDVGAWLIGPVKGKQNEVQTLTEKMGVSSYVEFVGRVPHETVFSYLHTGDAGLALLDPERFERDIPLKLFEYMYSEIPVVTTPIGASEKFIDDEWGIVVPFGDTKKQAEQVAELLTDSKRVDRMGAKGKEKVLKEYSWEIEKEKLLSLYDYLVDD